MVLFVRQVSGFFGNIKIDPHTIYAQGITIKSFAVTLYNRLKCESPELLRALNIKEESDGIEYQEKTVDSINDSFEHLIARNIRFLEGLRGLFACLVLLDHYYPTNTMSESPVLQQDTNLFVLLSGFTVALKLRSIPALSYSYGNITLQPPKLFPWKHFIVTRMIGLFPTLWFALLLSIPSWNTLHDSNHSKSPKNENGICSFLYVVGMQTWFRPYCKAGPNYVIYASIILNCFIIYTIIRLILHFVQKRLMSWREDSLISSCNLFCDRDLLLSSSDTCYDDKQVDVIAFTKGRKWSQYIGNISTLLCYNRSTPRLAFFYLSFCFVFNTGTMTLVYSNQIGKNALLYIAYMYVGVFAASSLSVLHCIHHKYCKNNGHYDDMDLPRRSSSSVLFYLWKHLPDILVIILILLLANVGHLDTIKGKGFVAFVCFHWIVVAFIIISMLQVERARFNVIRYILESHVLNVIGYCSYPLYLFQRLIIEYYVTNLYKMSINGPISDDFNGRTWFSNDLYWGWRIIIILVLVTFCYFIRYIMDEIVVIGLLSLLQRKYKTNDNNNTILEMIKI